MLKDEHIEQLVVKYIKSGDTVSIGTSGLGEAFLKKLAVALAAKHVDLENVEFVPTSNRLAVVASQLHLPLVSLNDSEIDVAIEFADSIDFDFNFIKRDSFSLVRDKMIAQSAGLLVVVADPKNYSKKLSGPIPFEVTTFGWKRTLNQLSVFGKASLVEANGSPKKTETGNFIVSVFCDPMYSFEEIEMQSKQIPGVLETGLFLGYADKILLHNKHIKMVSRLKAEKRVWA